MEEQHGSTELEFITNLQMGQEFEAQAFNQHATSPANSLTQNVGKENDLTSMELSLGPGPPLVQSPASSTLQNLLLDPTGLSTSILNARSPSDNSRKKIRKEIEKFGRNIKQRLCLGGGGLTNKAITL